MFTLPDVQTTIKHTHNNVSQVNPPCAGRLAVIDGCEETIIFQHDYSESKTTKVNCLALFTYLRMRMDFKTNIVKGITHAQIAGDLGICHRTLLRTLNALRAMGLLTWTGRTKQVSTYALRPRPSQKQPIISDTRNVNPPVANGVISDTRDANKALLVTPELHTSDQRSNDDDDHPSIHHQVVGVQKSQKPKQQTANSAARHRGHRSPPASPARDKGPELPASWRALKLGEKLDRLAQQCLADGWQAENLIAAHERSQDKDDPDRYLGKCLTGKEPTRPMVRRNNVQAQRSYSVEDFEDSAPRKSYQVEGYALPPLPPMAVAT